MLSPKRHQEARASSPNYFGLAVEATSESRETSGLVRENWNSASSSVKSFAAALPKQIPLEPNADFEAFKRQADINRGKSFSLPTAHQLHPPSLATPVRPRPPRWHTHVSDADSDSFFPSTTAFRKDGINGRIDVDQASLHDSAYVSSDSKRNSEVSTIPMSITGMPRFDSPRLLDLSQCHTTTLSKPDGCDSRLSLMTSKVDPPSPQPADMSRAATLPSKLDSASRMMSVGDLKELVDSPDSQHLLLLDIRSSQSHALSHIRGALNLCIPTTLLKRPTFNIQKLQQTFHGGSSSSKFSRWRDMRWIVVYDAHASDKRDAVTAQNMIRKFTNEGYSGSTAILRGGFTLFEKTYPKLVDEGCDSPTSPSQSNSNSRASKGLAPVIGGVNLPQSTNEPDPFFSNIRQNIDLADGVGQLEVAWPLGLDLMQLPHWLRDAASNSDKGKRVSDKFLRIELDEQSRMRSAYAAFNPNLRQESKFYLSGVEKGCKNRYKDILPFDHARVRLQHKPEGSCDYVNASHLKTSGSNKRYIASQGPLPATFEDFWTVIWEQDVRVVVMLTAESEGGQLKCHSYWKGRDFGALKLKSLSERKVSLNLDKQRSNDFKKKTSIATGSENSTPTKTSENQDGPSHAPYVIVRKFALSHAAYPFAPIREITHLHFSSWPDFGTPAQPAHLLALVELANLTQQAAFPVETANVMSSMSTWQLQEPEKNAHTRPMLVHCSAGCGRTGTFCTVDTVIDMMKRLQLSKMAVAHPSKDLQGDVAMTDDHILGPHGAFQAPHAQSFFTHDVAYHDKGTSQIDTNWMHDDTIDLIQRTVEEFREQRLSMVQTLRQYVLCYETVLEWIYRTSDRKSAADATSRMRAGGFVKARHES
ncbi:hypothetical protein CDD81_1533 [Ophiocordyceps australis]|uniref:protein-tyrosine-phosphatase n=1 Tax=Ophiocordyceps australis TaxID=1399860 RepID=A0A2C5YDP0_9HYPO|nr:hypothetical protein CDD81_1533 [Ophiocordyceps australis]